MEDLGIIVGQTQKGEKIGGFHRPKIADEVHIQHRATCFALHTCIIIPLDLSPEAYWMPSLDARLPEIST